MPVTVLRGLRSPGQAWTPKDLALARALQWLDDATCSGCGQLLEECMDPANAGRYVTPDPERCFACTSLELAMERRSNPEETKAARALRYTVSLIRRTTGQ